MTDATAPTPRPNWFSRLAHPGAFLNWSRPAILPLAVLSALCFAAGLWLAFFSAPLETENVGTTLPILYIHVPNAWLSQFVYAVMAIASLGTLVWRHPLADVAAKSAAPLGAAFTALALYTGSLWGRPTWGTFWEWDGRMTSTLILFLIYCGIIALWRAFDDQGRAARIAAVVTLVGALNIPVIKFSVDWWHTLHQSSTILVPGGPRMATSILVPLFLMVIAFTLLFLALHIVSMRTEILRRRATNLERQAAMGAR
ncbi:MAG TPA: heme ABC transporter permease [Devosia sp.]|nr:heme ABC transporter permease [Devosia sp.]